MRLRTKLLFGRTDKGGHLKIREGELEAFCKLHPDKAVTIRLEVQATSPSARLTNYFFGYVVKEMRQAFFSQGEDIGEADTYEAIRRHCPHFWEEKREKGVWKWRAKEWEELDSTEAVDAIAWIQRWASTEFYWVIEDPQV